MRSVVRPALVWAVFASATLVGPNSFAACQIEKVAELAVTMSDLQPTVSAKIDGKEVRLLADTGAFYSIISPAKAADMKLLVRPGPFDLTVEGVGGVMRASVATVKDFRLDTMSLRQVEFIVGGSGMGAGVDGVLGRNLLTGFDSEYDLANGAIRLMRPTGCGGRALAYWRPGDYSAVDMVIGDEVGGHPEIVVPVVINGKELKATLDTGASNTVIWRSAAARAGISVIAAKGADETYTSGVGRRQVRDFVAQVASFKIAGEEIKNTQISVAETAVEGSDMLLGADFFLAHRVYFSNAQHRVYFTYSGGPVFRLGTKPVVAAGPALAAGAVTDAAKPGAESEPTDAAGFSRRGQAFASRRDYPHAIADLDRAMALAPDNTDYLYQRAQARAASGQKDLALADLQQALKLRPDDADARYGLAQMRFASGDIDAGAADLRALDKIYPSMADERLGMAELSVSTKPDFALTQYNAWIDAHPEDSRRWEALAGRCWARALLNTELDKALADCETSRRIRPTNTAMLDSEGLIHLRRGEFAQAIIDYNGSLAATPDRAWSLYGRGVAKIRTGDVAGGKADIDAATAIRPTMAAVAAGFGVTP